MDGWQTARRILRIGTGTLAVTLWLASAAVAQVTTGTIEGTVTDSSQAVLPGVTVTVTNLDTGISRAVVSDDAGRYRALNLSVGNYEVHAELSGFRAITRRGIVLTIRRLAVVDLTLDVGAVSDEVVVTGEAPLVNTKEAGLSGLTDGTTIRELPINGRDILRLTLLETGAVPITYRKEIGKGMGLQISMNGARPAQTGYLLDGSNIKTSTNFQTPGSAAGVMLGVDSIREFEVLSNGFSSEYGNASGGIVSAVTRSGTNAFSGSAFEFHRNEAFDARNFFDREKLPYSRHQYGGTLGGPIARGRTFFFVTYEGLREELGLTSLMVVPTAAAREGNLPSGRVTVAPTVRPYLDLWPLPNGRDFGDGTGEASFSYVYPTREHFVVSRVDHRLGQNDQVYVRYSFDDANSTSRKGTNANSNFGVEAQTRTHFLTGEYTKVLGPKTLNMARVSFNRSDRAGQDAQLRDVDPALSFVPGLFGLIRAGGLTDPGVDGKFPQETSFTVLEVQDHISFTLGKHVLKAGFQGSWFRDDSFGDTRPGGEYRFGSLSDFLQGRPNRLRIPGPGSDSLRDWSSSLFGLFIQDNFEVSRRVTLNLGLRYEFITVPKEADGKIANLRNLDTDVANTVGDPLFENPSLLSFAPRVGFAWDPRGNGKSSVRGGFGVYYDQLTLPYLQSGTLNRNRPFYFDASIRNPIFPDALRSLRELPPTQVLEAPTPVQYQADQPTLFHYNVSVQREILPQTVVTLAYAGSRGRNLTRLIEYNNVVPIIQADGRAFFPAGATRRNPIFDTIDQKAQDGSSSYNSGQVRISKRLSNGFLLNAAYTLAKSVDDASNGVGASDYTYPSEVPNWYEEDAWKGLSEFDVHHSLSVYAVYELPVADTLTGAAGALLKGWQIGGIVAVRSGTPFPIKIQTDRARTLGKTDTQVPDLRPGASSNPIRPGNPKPVLRPVGVPAARGWLLRKPRQKHDHRSRPGDSGPLAVQEQPSRWQQEHPVPPRGVQPAQPGQLLQPGGQHLRVRRCRTDHKKAIELDRLGERSVPDEAGSPLEGGPFEESDEGVGQEAERAVHEQRDDDDVGAQELAGVHAEVPDAARGVDLLGEHEHQPADREGEAQPGEESGQRAGRTTWRTSCRRGRARTSPADSTSRASTLRIAAYVLM